MRNHPIFILLLLLFTLIFYIILGLFGDIRSEIEKYWLLIIPIYLIYILLIINTLRKKLPDKISFFWFIIFGVLFRIALMPSEPFLSDDIYRYLWDGKIFSAGINPYKYAPVDIHLHDFRDQIVYPFINFPEIATSYPPVSQFMFFINQLLGGSILNWKILLFFSEIILFLILFRLVQHFKLDKFRLLIYFYNPLLIIETYSSGHLEIAGALFFWIGVYLFYKHHDGKSLIFFVMSIMTKFITLLSSLPFLIKRFFRKSALLILMCSLLLLPFLFSGILPLPGLFSYINRWEFNGGLYRLVTSFMNLLDIKQYQWMDLILSGHLETFYFSHAFYYKVCAVFILLAVFFNQMNKLRLTSDYRSINFIQRSFILTSGFMLLTPTLHPWYLIWIIPFLVFTLNWSWLLFTFLIQASYFVLKDYALTSVWKESVWVLFFQYVPFYTLLIWEYLDVYYLMPDTQISYPTSFIFHSTIVDTSPSSPDTNPNPLSSLFFQHPVYIYQFYQEVFGLQRLYFPVIFWDFL